MSKDSDKTTVRFAAYLEGHHHCFLDEILKQRRDVIDDSPYTEYSVIEIEDAFYGTGDLLASSFALYEMFGNYMSGLDIIGWFNDTFEGIISSDELDSYLAAQTALMDDDISTTHLPAFLYEMRNINAVTSSSFIIGKTRIENQRLQELARMSHELKYRLIPLITERWIKSLNFSKTVIIDNALLLKLYFSFKMFVDEVNYKKILDHYLWPFRVMEYERKALATLTGAAVQKKSRERSLVSKGLLVCSYTVTGAYIGSAFPPYGTIIGGIIGFIVGVAIVLME